MTWCAELWLAVQGNAFNLNNETPEKADFENYLRLSDTPKMFTDPDVNTYFTPPNRTRKPPENSKMTVIHLFKF